MLCEAFMQRTPFTGCNDTLQTAGRIMRANEVDFLPVVGADRRVVGVLTAGDIVRRAVADGFEVTEQVAQFMTCDVLACRTSDSVTVAAALLVEHGLSRIVCVDGFFRLRGIMTRAALTLATASFVSVHS